MPVWHVSIWLVGRLSEQPKETWLSARDPMRALLDAEILLLSVKDEIARVEIERSKT